MIATDVAAKTLDLGVVLSAFFFGFRHGIDWDHIAAITDITSTQDTRGKSMFFGTLYALGHALVVLVIGSLAILVGESLSRDRHHDGEDRWIDADRAGGLRHRRIGASRTGVPDAEPVDADLQRRA